MGWIVESLVEVVLSLVAKIMEFFMGAFSYLTLDIGYSEGFKFGDLFDIGYYMDATGLLDRIFPEAGFFLPLFMYLALAGVFFIMVFKIVQSILDVSGRTAEHPAQVVATSVAACVGVVYSYSVFIMLELLANALYEPFRCVYEEKIMGNEDLAFAGIWEYLTNPAELFPSSVSTLLGGPALGVIMLALLLALLIQFIRLVLEAFERYVVLGLMFYTCPLAFSCLASKGSRKIFSNWSQMLLSQFLLMVINLFFLGVFYAGFARVFSPGELLVERGIDGHYEFASTSPYIFASPADFMVKMFILIGWLTVGQKTDQHLRSLGLSVAQTGAGLGAAVIAGAAGAVRLIQGAGRTVKGAARTASGIKEGIESRIGAARQGMETAARNDSVAGERTLPPGVSKSEAIENLYTGSSAAGRLSGSAVDSAMNMPLDHDGTPIEIKGAAAGDVYQELSGKNADQIGKTVAGDDGVFRQPYQVASAEVSDHKVSGFSSEGEKISEIGNADDWHAVDENGNAGAAAFVIKHGDSTYIQGATQGHIDHASSVLGKQLQCEKLDPSVQSKIAGWESVYKDCGGIKKETGAYVAKDAKGREVARWMPVKENTPSGHLRNIGAYTCIAPDGRTLAQASLDGVVDLDRGKGSMVSSHSDAIKADTGFSFSVQNNASSSNLHTNLAFEKVDESYAVYTAPADSLTCAYEKIRPAAAVDLAKNAAPVREYSYAQKGRSEQREVDELNYSRSHEDKVTRQGRVLNQFEGKTIEEKLNRFFGNEG